MDIRWIPALLLFLPALNAIADGKSAGVMDERKAEASSVSDIIQPRGLHFLGPESGFIPARDETGNVFLLNLGKDFSHASVPAYAIGSSQTVIEMLKVQKDAINELSAKVILLETRIKTLESGLTDE